MDKQVENTFQIILHAGDARSKAINAIQKAEAYLFEEAADLLSEAKEEMKLAHKIQTEMMQQEIGGDKKEFSILLVHGQDHFAMATVTIDMAETALKMYRKMKELEEK